MPAFGIALPQVFIDGVVDLDLVRQVAKHCGPAGFRNLWVQEQLVGTAAVLEPITLLSYAAAVAPGTTMGIAVLPLPQRSPVVLAKQLTTLDHLTRGKLIVGLGLGSPSLTPRDAGVPVDGPLGRFREGIGVLNRLWSSDDARMEPKPLQHPRPPLWLGGRHLNALRRAVEFGDGWIGAGVSPTAEFARNVTQLDELLHAAHRDRRSFTIAKRVYVAIDDSRDRAKSRIETWLRAYYRRSVELAGMAVWGSAAEVGTRLTEVAAAGADLIIVSPVDDPLGHMHAIGERFSLGGGPSPGC